MAPGDFNLRCDYGILLTDLGRLEEAIHQYERATEISSAHPQPYYNLGLVYERKGAYEEALKWWREGHDRWPDELPFLVSMARLLASCPEASLRNGSEAVRLARKAAGVDQGNEIAVLDALGIALAEVGKFPEAIAATEKAIEWALGADQIELAAELRSRVALYRAGRPYRETPGKAGPSR
jgi:tetratricopeptide (TPR) repeat protein